MANNENLDDFLGSLNKEAEGLRKRDELIKKQNEKIKESFSTWFEKITTREVLPIRNKISKYGHGFEDNFSEHEFYIFVNGDQNKYLRIKFCCDYFPLVNVVTDWSAKIIPDAISIRTGFQVVTKSSHLFDPKIEVNKIAYEFIVSKQNEEYKFLSWDLLNMSEFFRLIGIGSVFITCSEALHNGKINNRICAMLKDSSLNKYSVRYDNPNDLISKTRLMAIMPVVGFQYSPLMSIISGKGIEDMILSSLKILKEINLI